MITDTGPCMNINLHVPNNTTEQICIKRKKGYDTEQNLIYEL